MFEKGDEQNIFLNRCVSECGGGDDDDEELETVFDVDCLVERVNG